MKFVQAALFCAVALSPVTCSRLLDQAVETRSLDAKGNSQVADKPWFCHDLECPKYTVKNHTSGYETRQYEKGKWASTMVSGLLYSPSVTVGFKRLFDYISGENANGTKIPMTAPVLTAISPGDGPFCKSNFTVSFFVPPEYQESTPEPKNKDVVLLAHPKCTAFVSQFGGFLLDDITLSRKVKALREDLVANKESFEEGMYFTASYDPPFRVQHRHNEIWFAEKASASAVQRQ